jgi:hypothetical protein
MAAAPTTHRAFGLRLRCAFPLSELPSMPVEGVDAELVLGTEPEVRDAFSGPADPPARHVGSVGAGDTFLVERGRAGDHLLALDGEASFHLGPGARTIACAPRDATDPTWRRFLLDTVLATAALVHGVEAFHAATFVRDGHAVAVIGAEGAGKSTLLAAALRSGAGFLGDDIACIIPDRRAHRPFVHPAPPLMNVPTHLPDGTGAEEYGEVLARFDDECWVAIAEPVRDACPLAAIAVLDRTGDSTTVQRLAPSPAILLHHSLTGGRDHDRLRARFELCADLAAAIPILRVTARADDPAELVVRALDASVASLAAADLATARR